jgi:hypothetical protein
MPKPIRNSHAQTIFLRAFQENPAGPPPDLWPSPAVFRKWLNRPSPKIPRIHPRCTPLPNRPPPRHRRLPHRPPTRRRPHRPSGLRTQHSALSTPASSSASTTSADASPHPPRQPRSTHRPNQQEFIPYDQRDWDNEEWDPQKLDLPDHRRIFYPIMEDPDRRAAYKSLLHGRDVHKYDRLFDQYECSHPDPNADPPSPILDTPHTPVILPDPSAAALVPAGSCAHPATEAPRNFPGELT